MPSGKPTFDSAAIEQQLSQGDATKALPPVNDWQPELSGDIDIFINRQGEWFHEGGRFERQSLVKLFSTILRKDDDDYYLLTPVEKWRIRVEDVPFLVTEMEIEGEGEQQCLLLTTNVGERVSVDQDHPLWVVTDPASGEPSPYVRVRDRLDALLARPVFYRLAELAEQVGDRLVVRSRGQLFPLD